MNPDIAIHYGQLVQAAYAMAAYGSKEVLPRHGSVLRKEYDLLNIGYKVECVIFGNDLAALQIGARPILDAMPFGLVLSNSHGDIVITLRGTDSIWEWLHNLFFFQEACPFSDRAGKVELGFAEIYKSFFVEHPEQNLIHKLNNWTAPIKSITLCGHSLGAALITLLALDIALNTSLASKLAVYNFGSPRVGDNDFTAAYDNAVLSSSRIANRCDLVTKLPFAPAYAHIGNLIDLNPIAAKSERELLINYAIPCQHNLNSYLYLLSLLPDATLKVKLDPSCRPLWSNPRYALFSDLKDVPVFTDST